MRCGTTARNSRPAFLPQTQATGGNLEGSDFWPPDRERGRIKEWYEGKWIELGPNSIFLGYRERHWTANLVRASVRFYLAH